MDFIGIMIISLVYLYSDIIEQEILNLVKADELFLVYILCKASSSLLNRENIHLHVLLFSPSKGAQYLIYAFWLLVLNKLCRTMEEFPLL